MRSTHLLKCLEQIVVSGAETVQKSPALGPLYIGQSKQEVLGGDELIAKVPGVGLGLVEDLIDLTGESWLRVRLLWIPRHLAADGLAQLRYADAELLENRYDDAFV